MTKISSQSLKNKLEAILFASGRKLDIEYFKSILEGESSTKIKNALLGLQEDYNKNSNVLMITQENDLWKINVREEFSELVRKIISEADLAKSVLETLSVIAWKSPILQSEVVNIRGNKCYDHIKELEDAGFISKEMKGRSYMIKVTDKFYEYFDIDGVSDMKEIFKKIKDTPLPPREEPNQNETTPDKVGKLDVVEVKQNIVEPIKFDTEKLGKLEVFDEGKLDEISKRVEEEIIITPREEFSDDDDGETELETSDAQHTKEIVEELLGGDKNSEQDEEVEEELDQDDDDLNENSENDDDETQEQDLEEESEEKKEL